MCYNNILLQIFLLTFTRISAKNEFKIDWLDLSSFDLTQSPTTALSLKDDLHVDIVFKQLSILSVGESTQVRKRKQDLCKY